jgi:6,7-dimethyl-8-ribityllumazine synthase
MSSKDKNLSVHDSNSIPSGKGCHIGIIVSEWNEEITFSLRDACIDTLTKFGVEPDNILLKYVPGAFELPLGARLIAGKEKLDAIICLGCVIKGETSHAQYIKSAVANGMMNLSLTSGKPVVFGVLTPNDKQQALNRAGGKYGNKGVEAATSALKMINLVKDCKITKGGIGFH